MTNQERPIEILAPAGGRESFLAAVAAGADAVYCGLKNFSARMEADNFALGELAGLTELAHTKGVRVHIALNTMLKNSELDRTGRMIDRLQRFVHPDALIIQDPGVAALARQAGYTGELHLSTLANCSFPAGLSLVREHLHIDRVVVPRELTIDELKQMAAACPPDLDLEIFVHGALCYAVSGRCYWSSFLGGRSGLRGRCVQPCRRMYDQAGSKDRFFSCRDLGLDVLVRPVASIPQVRSWKIEGRKKGPHYVFYTVKAYRLLRDHGNEPASRKMALELLGMALSRKTSHYAFLSQRKVVPIVQNEDTGSGLFMGTVQGGGRRVWFSPRARLLSGDLLRIGYEDQPWHRTLRIRRAVPKKGRLDIPCGEGRPAPKGSPVFLIDRREPELSKLISELGKELQSIPHQEIESSDFRVKPPKVWRPVRVKGRQGNTTELRVFRQLPTVERKGPPMGTWVVPGQERKIPRALVARTWWWLPPVIWPDREKVWEQAVTSLVNRGARTLVVNAPWQMGLFEASMNCRIWAGPFCNIANPLAIQALKDLGAAGVIVSPELAGPDFLALPGRSPLPLGVVINGIWPLCISRIKATHLKSGEPFTSPKRESAWTVSYGDLFWTFPNWFLDIREKKQELIKAGYQLFVHMRERIPKNVEIKDRPGLWNWDLKLL
ncbi:U32 family peptidase [Desulfoplanes formicivorans]|uniref:Peptidase U32 n=1 Tax=Desulfoplanes formicivorans TaxID=1592317 RepID=A0A194AFQ6_9BACT|nr:U32 family peptidase [Desulfoplanes formicivorans]GAU07916.1 peptidase U32 [Desulfoplanes formicivorans]